MKTLKAHDYTTALWLTIENELTDKLEKARTSLEACVTHDESMVLRGQIKELRYMLAKPKEPRFKSASNID